MRKLMLLAAMLAMVMVAAAPAFAQAIVASDDDVDNSVNQYIDCTQVQAALADQSNYGDANAAADDGEAVAAVSQELGISQDAVLNCVAAGEDADVAGNTGDVDVTINGVDDDGDGVVDEADGTEVAAAEAAASSSAASSSAAAGSAAAGSAAASSGGTLPDTGGASLFTLGAGALLVGGGLLARRIFS